MFKAVAYRSIGLMLLIFCGVTWAWMLGAFADMAVGVDSNTAKWLNPGILSMPGTLSTIAGVIGFLYLTGVFPLFDQNPIEGTHS